MKTHRPQTTTARASAASCKASGGIRPRSSLAFSAFRAAGAAAVSWFAGVLPALHGQTPVVIPPGSSYTLNAATGANYIINAGDTVGFAGTSPVAVIIDSASDSANWTLTNNGRIGYASIAAATGAGPYAGVYFMSTGLATLTNNGSIITGTDPGAARTAVGVNITAGGLGAIVNNSGLIWSNASGIRSVYDSGLSITNSGTIMGFGLRNATAANHRAGISVERGSGTITNTGFISGGTAGIAFLSLTSADGWLVDNSGTISGSTSVSGVNALGLHVAAGSGTLINSGEVFGSYAGVMLLSATNTLVQNNAGGVIRSVATGNISSPGEFVTSAVVIAGGTGNRVVNDGGLIYGGRRGITVFSKDTLVENKNSGTIMNTNDVGIAFDGTASGTILNTTGAVIGNASAAIIGIFAAVGAEVDVYNDATARIETGNNTAVQNRGVIRLVNDGIISSANTTVYHTASGTFFSVDNRGLITTDAFNAVHFAVAAASDTVVNSGTIIGFRYGIASVANSFHLDNKTGGLVDATGTHAISLTGGSGTIFNSGTITGAQGGIILTSATGFLIQNNPGGLIESRAGTSYAVDIGILNNATAGRGTRLINDGGLIKGATNPVRVMANGVYIENKNSGTLQAVGSTGILFQGLSSGGTVVNTGSSLIAGAHGITVQGTAFITNAGASRIAATTGRAVINYSVGSYLFLDNTGASTITSGERAVWLREGTVSDIINQGGSTISNTGAAFEAFQIEGIAARAIVTNTSGAIITSASQTAIAATGSNAGITIKNAGGATISGFRDAINFAATNTLSLDNDALITGAAGVRSAGALTLVNGPSGLIEGTHDAAILITGGTAGITNSGTLRGADSAAVVFAAGAEGSLTLDTGSVLEGDAVSASSTGNKLFLAGSGSESRSFTGDAGVAGSGFETLAMNGAAWTLSGLVTLSGSAADALAVNSGTLTLAGALARPNGAGVYAGPGGRLVLGFADTPALSLSATLAAGGEMEFAFHGDSVFSGTIDGAGGIIKSGAARQTLSGLNLFDGRTLVSAGALIVSGSASRLRGDIDVASGATFGGQESVGIAGKTITLNPGASLLVGVAATPQTLVIDGTLAANSASFLFDLYTGGTSDRLVITPAGALTLAGSNTIALGAFVGGTFNLGNIATLSGAVVTVGGLDVNDSMSRQAATVSASGGDLLLVTSAGASRLLRHTGAPGDFIWSAAGISAIPFANGDTLVLDSAADSANPANRDITIPGVFATVSDLFVSGTGDYTLRGAAIIADRDSVVAGSTEITAATAGGRLVKTGAGRLALAGSGESHFKGGVELGGGVLALESAGALGQSDISVTGDGALLEIATGGVDVSGDLSLGAHTLAIDTTGRDARISGGITGSGALVKRGAGALSLDGANAFSGGLAIEAGAVSTTALASLGSGVIDVAAGGTLALNTAPGDILFDRALGGAGVFAVSLASGADRFVFAPAAAFSGELRLERGAMLLDTQTAAALAGSLRIGAEAFVEKAAGDISLRALAFSGGTLALTLAPDGALDGIITAGALDAGTGGAIAVDAARFTSDRDNPPVPPAAGIFDSDRLSGVRLVAAGTVSGSASFTLVDLSSGSALPSPLQFNILQQGDIVANADYGHTLALQDSGSAQGIYLAQGITGLNVLAGKTLLLDNTGAPQSTLSAVISGAGGIEIRAAADSPIKLTAANTHTGPTRLVSGVVMVSNTGAFGKSESVTIDRDATLDISLTGNNSRQTLVRELSGEGAIVLGNATLAIEVNGETEFSGVITGSNNTLGRLVKTGTGTFTLSGDNRFGDRTYVNAGRVRVTSRTGLGNGAFAIIAPSAVLEFNGVSDGPQGKIWFDGGGRLEVIDSVLALEVPYNRLGSLAISGSSLVTALGSTGTGVNWNGSLGGKTTAVTVGAGSTLAIAPRPLVAWGNIVANSGTVWAGSLTLDGGALRLDPGATLAVTDAVTINDGGKIAFGGGGVAHLDAASFNTSATDPLSTGTLSLYDVPKGMSLLVTARAGGYDYTVVNQSSSPLRGINLAFHSVSAALDAVDEHLDDRFLLPVGDTVRDRKRAWTNTAWLKGLFSEADYEDNDARPGHSERMRGLVAGIDARNWSRHFIVGLYAGMSGANLNTTNDLTIESAQRFAGIHAAFRAGAFYANIGVATGKMDADVYRDEPAGQIRGTYAASHLATALGAGFVFNAWKGGSMKPSVTLRHTRVKLSDYEERGPGAMLVPDFSETLLQSIARLRADQSFTVFGRPSAIGLSLGWRQALSDPSNRLDAAFATNPGSAITLVDGREPRASALIGLSLRSALGRATVLSLDAEHDMSADRVRDTFSLSLGHSW